MKTLIANRTLLGVLLLLVVVVLLPTAGVLWFMTVAVRNERAAVRETLTAAYRSQLDAVRQQLAATFQNKRAALTVVDAKRSAAETFAGLVRAGVADSLLLYDERGEVLYPGTDEQRPVPAAVESKAWLDAQRLEFGESRHDAAAAAYGRIARNERDDDVAARALQAQARCLGKAGKREDAVEILTGALAQPRFAGAVDAQGRLIAPDGWLLALRMSRGEAEDHAVRAAALLRARLENYGSPSMPVSQRRFLMRQLRELLPEEPPVDTLAAEDLAARYLESGLPAQEGTGLSPSGLAGVWQLAAAGGRVVALYREESVRAEALRLAGPTFPAGVEIDLRSPGTEAAERPAFLTLPGGEPFPGWSVALYLSDQESVDAAADAQVTAYVWTGVLLIMVLTALAFAIARLVGRQIRLTRLKNDLVATVTHELKTPLASMRLLVDTLLEEERNDERKVREYLELIAKENTRLSRLIEDFLTFSRMERNKQVFVKKPVPAGEIARTAADAVAPRFDPRHCRFDVQIAPDLPQVAADSDALATVVVNLLDNAYKYTREDKHIILRAFSKNGDVCFSVRDNGIGLSRRAVRRVFDRFYQADQRLSRAAGGVGLGLSIVKFIVDAHGGRISVDSRPGQGSTFTVSVPPTGAGAGR